MSLEMVEPVTLGMDLGGTTVDTALVDAKGRILSSHRYPTGVEKGADRIITDIVTCVNQYLSKHEVMPKALGIGIAAQVNSSGVVRRSPNLGWKDVPLKTELEDRLRLPVCITNDVRAATWGEWCFGAGRGVEDLAVLFVGTGIGGGVISRGEILEGCSFTAGELGHMTIIVNGRDCRCPNKGCLEAYAGGWAIAQRSQEVAAAEPLAAEAILSLAGTIEGITAVHVSQAFHDGDLLAKRLIEETGQYLAAGLVSVINAFNPCLIILGGGVIEGMPELISAVQEGVMEKALLTAVENLKVVKAALGNKAGVVGAAALAQSMIMNRM